VLYELTYLLTYLCGLTGEPIILCGRGLSGLIRKKLSLVCLNLSNFPLKAWIPLNTWWMHLVWYQVHPPSVDPKPSNVLPLCFDLAKGMAAGMVKW